MSQSEEAWNEVGEQFKKLGSMFKHHYEEREGEEAGEEVSEGEVAEAVRSVGDSIKAAFGAVGDAATDPDLRDEARQTAGSFLEALGVTFTELGEEISRRREGGDT